MANFRSLILYSRGRFDLINQKCKYLIYSDDIMLSTLSLKKAITLQQRIKLFLDKINVPLKLSKLTIKNSKKF